METLRRAYAHTKMAVMWVAERPVTRGSKMWDTETTKRRKYGYIEICYPCLSLREKDVIVYFICMKVIVFIIPISSCYKCIILFL